MKEKYDIIYSIGDNCGCAMYLSDHNLRATSGPLDWLVGQKLKDSVELIVSDFKNLLKQNLFIKTQLENSSTHDTYKNTFWDIDFIHDFPVGIPIGDSFSAVEEKYQRRINRFYELIKNKNRVLFVWFSLSSQDSNEEIIDLSKKLNNKFKKEIDLLIIEHDETKALEGIEKIKLNNNITCYKLYAKGKDGNPEQATMGNETICNKIFKNYSLNMSLSNKIKHSILQAICTIGNCFIPSKSLRQKWRSKFKFGS
ncbi:MAG: DUF1796 family putative cysteine peptidase [Candidatus Gastranaerophilales bacterium]|nr:DUF1796 family putative cysteine peptidase [Candidatus Gastranaerophilales bacterium]